jgi:hypothetical protein
VLRRAANYFATVPPVFLDGAIYVGMSIASLWVGILGSEQARTLIGTVALFWISSIVSTLNTALLALKMFRSTSFADHQKDKQKLVNQGKDDELKTF